ncbi:hypothetical protein EVAR_44037_1 [Eumeta japonica]|uniref:Uncharacterized protein n=1 Tax=Eumeta variegata TaxID=151549 RepID=A0A4C1XKE1_EUMVA|nr:hypothetical protein EVAR_44037_1 [Eumeta japonica]
MKYLRVIPEGVTELGYMLTVNSICLSHTKLTVERGRSVCPKYGQRCGLERDRRSLSTAAVCNPRRVHASGFISEFSSREEKIQDENTRLRPFHALSLFITRRVAFDAARRSATLARQE